MEDFPLNFGDQFGGVAYFANSNDLSDWIDDQQREIKNSFPQHPHFRSLVADDWRLFANAIVIDRTTDSQKSFDEIQQRVFDYLPVMPGSEFFKQLHHYLRVGEEIAISAYSARGGLLGKDEVRSLRNFLQSGDKIESLNHQIDLFRDAVSEARQNLDELREVSDRRIGEAEGRAAELANQFPEIQSVLEGFKARMDEIADDAANRIVQSDAKLSKEWQDVIDAHKQKLELHGIYTLWQDRAYAHKGAADRLLKAAWICGILSPIITIITSAILFHWSADIMGISVLDDKLHQVIFATAGTALILTLCLWATRLLVRLYMTQHHLTIDADARSALGNTYLKLVAEGAAASDDRKIVLAALFRPVNDGIVQDDALPFLSPSALATSALMPDKPKPS